MTVPVPPRPVVPPPAQPQTSAAAAREWGRADDDGTVWVRTGDGERRVGQYPGVSRDEALTYFVRKYEELAAQVGLLEQRLAAAQVTPADAEATVKRLRPAVVDANVVGDLEALLGRLDAVLPVVKELRAQEDRGRQEARAAAVRDREALVAEAEGIAAADPERVGWKASGDRLRELFEQWRSRQHDARLDKRTEDELWKRFSHARTTFDRKRRQHFGALDEERTRARQDKEDLVRQAEQLSTSTDWAAGAASFRDLMTRWKASGRAAKRDDDELWSRFRSAQEAFFARRQAATAEVDAEFAANLVVKEELATAAEALLPVRDLPAAKRALRDIQARWDAAGKVPRSDVARIDARLRAVEQAVRDAEQNRWKRSNPEAQARATDLVSQLERTIAGLESELAQARDAGDAKRAAAAEQSLVARREWLDQVRRTATEYALD